MREQPTKSMEISERLRQEILDGKFDDVRKLPSEHQLMRRFAVARETVRAAIRELLDKKLVERRHGYGTFLADIAKTKAAQKFAMIVPGTLQSFWVRVKCPLKQKSDARSFLTAWYGRGCWVVCGPDRTPVPTLRLENFRDGLEDFAYVKILEEKLKAVREEDISGWSKRARELVSVPSWVCAERDNFSTDPAVIYAWRDAVADLIEAMP